MTRCEHSSSRLDKLGIMSSNPDATTRSTNRRYADVIMRLEEDDDLWVATAGPNGAPHLVPLSLCWHDGAVIVAVPRSSPTAENIRRSGLARLAVGHTRDVVMIDALGELDEAPDPPDEARYEAFARRTGWDVRSEAGDYVLIRLTPWRVQAWRNEAEISGRTVMANGAWVA